MFDKFEGRLFGYARVSTEEQNLDLQMDALVAAGVDRDFIYHEKHTGRKMNRPQLKNVLKVMRKGDCLVVWKLDRLGRSALGLAQTVKDLEENGMHFRALDYNIDTTQPFGKLVFQIMAAIAELESAMISQRTKAGVAAAKARGVEFGRKHYILSYPKRLKKFTEMWIDGDIPDGRTTAMEVIAEMHKADPKAPVFKSTGSYTNWKSQGFPGFDIEAANILKQEKLKEADDV